MVLSKVAQVSRAVTLVRGQNSKRAPSKIKVVTVKILWWKFRASNIPIYEIPLVDRTIKKTSYMPSKGIPLLQLGPDYNYKDYLGIDCLQNKRNTV